jgi:hypothetical protein
VIRRPPVPFLCGAVLAVLLTSCAGRSAGGDAAAASAAEHNGGTVDVGSQDAGPTDPAPTGGGAGGDQGDGQAGGNAGAPGDVAVFEEAGVPYFVLRDDAVSRCANGLCRLLEPVPTGNPDDVGGIDQCIIRTQSDIHYDPPAQNGFFQTGATVQVHVDCTVDQSQG